jgi:FYVE zinc finger
VRFLPFQIPIKLSPTSKQSSRVNSRYDFTVECDISGAFNLVTHLDCQIIAPQFMFSSSPPALPPLAQVPQEVSFRPPWEPDAARTDCTRCHAEFGLFKRRHHCRHCGKLFCSDCCNKETKIPLLGYDEEPVRVCHECLPIALQGGKYFQEAPVWAAHENVEPEWQRPPNSVGNNVPEASAPSSNALNDNTGNYPDLYK